MWTKRREIVLHYRHLKEIPMHSIFCMQNLFKMSWCFCFSTRHGAGTWWGFCWVWIWRTRWAMHGREIDDWEMREKSKWASKWERERGCVHVWERASMHVWERRDKRETKREREQESKRENKRERVSERVSEREISAYFRNTGHTLGK